MELDAGPHFYRARPRCTAPYPKLTLRFWVYHLVCYAKTAVWYTVIPSSAIFTFRKLLLPKGSPSLALHRFVVLGLCLLCEKKTDVLTK